MRECQKGCFFYAESEVAGRWIRTTNDQTLQETVRKGRPDQGHEAHGVLWETVGKEPSQDAQGPAKRQSNLRITFVWFLARHLSEQAAQPLLGFHFQPGSNPFPVHSTFCCPTELANHLTKYSSGNKKGAVSRCSQPFNSPRRIVLNLPRFLTNAGCPLS